VPIFCRFRDIMIHCSKIANFYTPPVFNAPFSVTSLNLCATLTSLKSMYVAHVHGAIFFCCCQHVHGLSLFTFNPLECKDNYSATSNNMKLVHWPLVGGLLHLVQRGWDWAGPQPAQAPPRCTKCNSPPING